MSNENYNDPKYKTVDKIELAVSTEEYYQPKLDLDKIESIDDCKKILDVLFTATFKPLRKGLGYSIINEISEYIVK